MEHYQYNTETSYRLEYAQATQEQVTSFDNNYLAFKEKSNIANLNKETFITVTQIIMSARKDGMNVAWKWMQENQQIPYSEFTDFYRDLSSFVSVRFSENKALEIKKQNLVKEHNKLLATYPGNFYNYFLKIEPLVYKEGFVTKETKELFK